MTRRALAAGIGALCLGFGCGGDEASAPDAAASAAPAPAPDGENQPPRIERVRLVVGGDHRPEPVDLLRERTPRHEGFPYMEDALARRFDRSGHVRRPHAQSHGECRHRHARQARFVHEPSQPLGLRLIDRETAL